MNKVFLNINILIFPEMAHLGFEKDKNGQQQAKLQLKKQLQSYLKKNMLYFNLLKKLMSGLKLQMLWQLQVMNMEEKVTNQKIFKRILKKMF